jgi:hypothetical protein
MCNPFSASTAPAKAPNWKATPVTDKDADKYGSDITQYSEVSEPGMFTNMDSTPFMKRG